LALIGLPTAAGRCSVSGLDVDGSHVAGRSAIAAHALFENAPALEEMVVAASRFARGPDRLAISVLPRGKLRMDRNTLNGRPAF
jgi:hypothetical protein